MTDKAPTPASLDNPILNNPYDEPTKHYATAADGSLNYSDVRQGRRPYMTDGQILPKKSGPQAFMFEAHELNAAYGTELINVLRQEVAKWRADDYPHVTRITGELLRFWFTDPERLVTQRLFFAQREAVETAVWLNEVAGKGGGNLGTRLLAQLREVQQVSADPMQNLPRVAFKMATGSGKTVVMAMLLLYHYFNRQEYRQDTRFADYFLLVAPGVTIRDRLGVLHVDTQVSDHSLARDYYRQRGLVPARLHDKLAGLNARIIITNYHAFEPRQLQGNKRSPLDGKRDADGKKVEAKEEFGQVVKRLLGKFRADSRLLVLNDEAHHCYLPKSKGKNTDEEKSAEENERAAVWFRGLTEIGQRFKLQQVYDLSATPYYLSGSGYDAYTLFPWVATDFGLIEAIESGLVKIPYLPESDDTHELEEAKLKDIYRHVKNDLPKRGARTQKIDEAAPPMLPPLVKNALSAFYAHYENESRQVGNLFSTPPVFIVVCNNTNVSSEVFKYLAGYPTKNAVGEDTNQPGVFDLFSNFDPLTRQPRTKPPTLLIDSDALENSGQIDEQFKRVFGPEIEKFKQNYRITHPGRSVEDLSDADLLREVMNTVGKRGELGEYVRCVVSVSMLTEGWDVNTVTHIMGLRAFGSQLLCEQVAGRALRRQSYVLQGYDKNGQPTKDTKKAVEYKFPPEYAHIIGVPFKLFKKGATQSPEPGEPLKPVLALPERQAELEIQFPVVTGYRVESGGEDLQADFEGQENFLVEGHKMPTRTVMSSAFSGEEQELTLDNVREVRLQQLEYHYARCLLAGPLVGADKRPQSHLFGPLRGIVGEWLATKVHYAGDAFPGMLLFYDDNAVTTEIMKGIHKHRRDTDRIRPVFPHYNNAVSSTARVRGSTSKDVWPTTKSHVNCVVLDSTWEGIAAKELENLEEMTEVVSYVKNQFMGFCIPYISKGKERHYFPDFIVKCRLPDGQGVNIVLEISGMAEEKIDKRWYVLNRWLPAVNAVHEQLGLDPWHFVEIANDITDIRKRLKEELGAIAMEYAKKEVLVTA
jgi:type III restriction enzyme